MVFDHFLNTDGKVAFMLRKLVATEGVGLDLLLWVGLNLALSSSPSTGILLVIGFFGSSL